MKVQEQTAKKVADKEYKKRWIVLPNSIFKLLKWKKGTELDYEIKDENLILKKK